MLVGDPAGHVYREPAVKLAAEVVEASYARCRDMARRSGSNFYLSFLGLPRAKRRAMDALYAFMRQTDDLADDPQPLEVRRRALLEWRATLQRALQGQFDLPDQQQTSDQPGRRPDNRCGRDLLPAMADVVEQFGVPAEHLCAVIDGVEMDLDRQRYETFDELQGYCEHVASAVGLACIHIWGYHGQQALEPARKCGIALQLTNILRDLREDAQRDRVYLPLEELRQFGYSVGQLKRGEENEEFGRLMEFQIDRAERFYREGAELIEWLERAPRRTFGMMMAIYRALLEKIKRRPADVLHRRIRLSRPEKLRIAARWTLLPPQCAHGRLGRRVAMSGPADQSRRRSVAVVGGGLAGLAAAAAASQHGLHVELFERHRQLGGRTSSFRDPMTGDLIDDCQHASMGCCTNLADFCRRMGVADCFQRYRTPNFFDFFGPQGTQHSFAASGWLPAPLHLAPALMSMGYLSIGERWAISRAMLRLARVKAGHGQPEETMGGWLRRHGQSERLIKCFWSVILAGALSEPVDCTSVGAAKKVFVDGFLAARTAYELELPKIPLTEIVRRVAARLAEQDVAIHTGTKVERIDGDAHRATAVVLRDGRRREFDFVVAAVPWRWVRPLFSEAMLAAMPALEGAKQILPATIAAVHLWFDRPITPLHHAVLVGRLGQWVFNHGPRSVSPDGSESGYYYQAVLNASHELFGGDREEVLGEVRRDLEATWAEARVARLLHRRLVVRPEAVFSCRPGVDRLRPAQQTPVENLMLAGDWTATGWPPTMEGAVRSGRLAVEGVFRAMGKEKRLLAPELPRGRLARLLLVT